MAADPFAMLRTGMEAGEARALRLYFDALGMGSKEFDPERLGAYAEKKARSRFRGEDARSFIGRLNPRDWDYVRKARLAAKYGWKRFGMTEAEAVELVNEAQAKRWHAKNGLEHRLLMAVLRAPSVASKALEELEPSDFVNPCYGALFSAWQENGPPTPQATAKLREIHGDVPEMTAEWWTNEASQTLAELVARRTRWTAKSKPTRHPLPISS